MTLHPCRVARHPLERGQWAVWDAEAHDYWRSALTGAIVSSLSRARLKELASDFNEARREAAERDLAALPLVTERHLQAAGLELEPWSVASSA